jgi:TctA family transporter
MFGAYGYAKARSKDPDSFGKGNPLGVLAPESANNAKEGGSFVPTLAFGIPGSSGMALVIVILLILGYVPGPQMIDNHMDIVFLIAWICALSNVLASFLGLAMAPLFAKLAFLRPQLLAPPLVAISLIGSFVDTRFMLSVLIAVVAGFVGYVLRALGYSLAGVILGFVLGPIVDQNLGLALQLYGSGFVLRPITAAILGLTLAAVVWGSVRKALKDRKNTPGGPPADAVAAGEQAGGRNR